MKKYDYHAMLEAILESVGGDIHALKIARHSTSKIITTLSKRLGVSRPTIYLWLEKFDRDRSLIEEYTGKQMVDYSLLQEAKEAYAIYMKQNDGDSYTRWRRALSSIRDIDGENENLIAMIEAIKGLLQNNSGRNSNKAEKDFLQNKQDRVNKLLDIIGVFRH